MHHGHPAGILFLFVLLGLSVHVLPQMFRNSSGSLDQTSKKIKPTPGSFAPLPLSYGSSRACSSLEGASTPLDDAELIAAKERIAGNTVKPTRLVDSPPMKKWHRRQLHASQSSGGRSFNAASQGPPCQSKQPKDDRQWYRPPSLLARLHIR
jgi:hypothetical protein